MAQTALQELIETIKQGINGAAVALGEDGLTKAEQIKYNTAVSVLKSVMRDAQSLLPKERQIIDDAHFDGQNCGLEKEQSKDKFASDYFTQNFNPIN